MNDKNNSVQYYESIDNILGAREQRFFGAGFKKVIPKISDIEVGINDKGEGCVEAKAAVIYPNDWSKKSKDKELQPHLSSIDAVVLSMQLNEIYLLVKYGLNEPQRKKMWVRNFIMKAGVNAHHDLKDFDISTRHIETKNAPDILDNRISIFESQIGTIVVRCEIEHEVEKIISEPRGVFLHVEDILGMSDRRYYGDGYKHPKQSINSVEIDIMQQKAQASISIDDIGTLVNNKDISAYYQPSPSILDCIITIAQMAQALLYKIDNIDRSQSNNLWMREINIECKNPYQPRNQFIASTYVTKTKLLKIKGQLWRTSDMICDFQDFHAHYSIAHELPNTKQQTNNILYLPKEPLMNQSQNPAKLRLAVSGTYSSGKTTTTLALSYLTGMPRTHAKTMREILPEALPGKRLEDCGFPELFQLGVRRYAERAVHESSLLNGFISDGSSLHEWVYGKARMIVGINPNDSALVQAIKSMGMLPIKHVYEQINENLGCVVKQHAKRNYDEFIHLPVEFPLVKDGHRPVSERFRSLSNQLLLEILDELQIKYHIVGGTIRERLEKILEIYGFTPVMDIDDAINLASKEVKQMQLEIEADAQKVTHQLQLAN